VGGIVVADVFWASAGGICSLLSINMVIIVGKICEKRTLNTAHKRKHEFTDQCCINIERAARAMGVWGHSPQEKDAAVRAPCDFCFVGCELVARPSCLQPQHAVCIRSYGVYDALQFVIFSFFHT